jgi:hypothetical protein
MKGKTLLVLAAVVLFGVSGAKGFTRPTAVRANGDPDEFQARQVSDEGLVLGHTTEPPESRTGDTKPGETASSTYRTRGTRAGAQIGHEIGSRVGRPRVSITISGEALLGKQRSRLLGG